ncbi:hypothetical protein H2199_005735 [Coniosporium tulheliwenetii]|uniref:Uncharacterized protein n=1 Tax=Coniosporium tulheliwenetii TaxID=3383036 RepID=A0ACC2Z1G3_9PEZI|nr:hypothetical protein H2199_005735 [Cladosporium sp. JES 115]
MSDDSLISTSFIEPLAPSNSDDSITASTSFIEPPAPTLSEDEGVDSLPSTSVTESEIDDEESSDADREWRSWAKFMEWKYPVEVVFTSPRTFKAAGAIEAAASL